MLDTSVALATAADEETAASANRAKAGMVEEDEAIAGHNYLNEDEAIADEVASEVRVLDGKLVVEMHVPKECRPSI